MAGVLLSLVAVACGGDAAVTTTTTSSITTSPSTTTTVPAEVEIPETGILKFRPGTTYVASRFWAPVSFTTDEDGWWWSQGAAELWVHVEYHDGGESAWDLDVSVIANDFGWPDDLVSDIVADDRLDVTSEPMTTAVAGHKTIVLDVLAVEVEQPVDGTARCDRDGNLAGNSRFADIAPGFDLMRAQRAGTVVGHWEFGVRECRAARIWVVDVDGDTIVIIAAALDEELFQEMIPAADALVAGIEFHP
jgi:hypothetical protein